jgi:AraC-like DNA-binding protein
MGTPLARRLSGPVAPLDIGCGTLLPLRWSDLCVVYHYDHNFTCAPNVVEDKPFEMHVLVATTRGRWQFFGRNGAQEIDRSIAVAGIHGDHYGCRHDKRFGDSNLIASLRQFAVDEDEGPLFGEQGVPIDAGSAVMRAAAATDDDDFDSRVFEIFDLVSSASLGGARGRSHGRVRMQRAKRFIEDHAFEEIALRDIAASVGMSPFACLRQFKSRNGMTPRAYLSLVRLERARRLLRTTALPIGDVGAAVGWQDRAYFSRWFAREMGMTPRHFRAK